MTVSAASANDLPRTAIRARHGLVELRSGARSVRAGTYLYDPIS